MHMTSMFKQYKYMNDIHVYSIWTYEKQILHDNYHQIMAHEVCDNWVGFKVMDTSRATMVFRLHKTLHMFSSTQKKLLMWKMKGPTCTYTNALIYIVSYNNLAMLEPFDG